MEERQKILSFDQAKGLSSTLLPLLSWQKIVTANSLKSRETGRREHGTVLPQGFAKEVRVVKRS